jgi:hypothetical protein
MYSCSTFLADMRTALLSTAGVPRHATTTWSSGALFATATVSVPHVQDFKMQYETCRMPANTYLRVHVPQAQAVPVHWVAQHFFGDPRGFLASSVRRRPPGLVRDSLEYFARDPRQSLPPKRVLLT